MRQKCFNPEPEIFDILGSVSFTSSLEKKTYRFLYGSGSLKQIHKYSEKKKLLLHGSLISGRTQAPLPQYCKPLCYAPGYEFI